MHTCKWYLSLLVICFVLPIRAQEKMDLILDADTGNEVDDLYAISRALVEPSWNILALNATHWQTSQWAEPNTMENSHRLNQVLLGHLGKSVKTRRGGAARMYDWGDQAQHSAAAYEIIKQARQRSEENKLVVVALGALTNVASAIYIEPAIEEKIKLYWLGTSYDFEKDILRKNDFNCMMDMQALDILLRSQVELHIIPVNVAAKMTFNFTETQEKLADGHRLGQLLVDRWEDHLDGGRQQRTIWDLALISSIIHPQWAKTRTITTSRDNGSREIHYFYDIDADQMRAEFFSTLKAALEP